MNLEIIHAGKYSRPETLVQKNLFCHIGLCLGGLDYMSFPIPNNNTLLTLTGADVPYLSLIPPDNQIDFRFNQRRENWVIQCRVPELQQIPFETVSILDFHGITLRLPFTIPITIDKASEYRKTFMRIQSLWQDGTPSGRLTAELLTIGIIGMLAMENANDKKPEERHPAAKLRRLIDADLAFSKTLDELSHEAGNSAAYLRRCFREVYQLEPGEYRARRRLDRIITLIAQSDLRLKEIADAVGMRHVTHLHAFVRERCGVTPGKLMKQHRGTML